jgi:hypothetical protein
VRSNDTKSSATKSSMPIKPRLRLSLAMMTAIATVFALVSSADAAQRRVASGGAGGSMASSAGRVDPGGARSAPDGRQIARRTAIGVRPADERYVRDEILIQLASSVPSETIDALGRRLRLNRAASFTANNITTFRWKILDGRPVPAVIRSLEAEPIVLAAQPNYSYQLGQEQQSGDQPSAAGRSSLGGALFNLGGSGPGQLAKGERR